MKMSFTPSPLTVTAILKHQDKAKSAGERHTRSDAINDLINHGDTLEPSGASTAMTSRPPRWPQARKAR